MNQENSNLVLYFAQNYVTEVDLDLLLAWATFLIGLYNIIMMARTCSFMCIVLIILIFKLQSM